MSVKNRLIGGGKENLTIELDTQDTLLDNLEEDIGELDNQYILGTKTITSNGTYNAIDDNIDGYSSVNVNVGSSFGFQSGVYHQISSTDRFATYKFSSSGNLTFTNRLYEILEINTTNHYIRCSTTDVYSKNFSNISLGVISPSNHEFISLGSGTRSGTSISVTLNTVNSYTANSFVVMKDNTTSKLYLVCNYFNGTSTAGSFTTTNTGTDYCIGRYYAASSLSLSPGSGTSIMIPHPFFRWTNKGVETTEECLGIKIS